MNSPTNATNETQNQPCLAMTYPKLLYPDEMSLQVALSRLCDQASHNKRAQWHDLSLSVVSAFLMSCKEPIIFVDDDADDHFICAEVCKKMGLLNETKFFRSGQDVLDYLLITEDKPFIIFCDMNMPQMNGLQLRKKINENDYLRKKSIPFVFLTTAAGKSQIREAYDLTVQGFFIKEQSFVETETTLKLVLDYWDKCRHPNSAK